MLFKNGQLAATKVGAMSKAQLTAFIDQSAIIGNREAARDGPALVLAQRRRLCLVHRTLFSRVRRLGLAAQAVYAAFRLHRLSCLPKQRYSRPVRQGTLARHEPSPRPSRTLTPQGSTPCT